MTTPAAATPLETVTLTSTLPSGVPTRVVVAPSRGAIVTRFFVGERPVLYLDEQTLTDVTKNVRGGNPVLFPSPGPLTGGTFTRDGKTGAMKQHGLARQRPWTQMEESASSVILELKADETTKPEFPWNFRLSFRFFLDAATLRIEQHIENLNDSPMPFAMGFHPYFFVPAKDKAATRIPTKATRAWDNVAKREIDLTGPIDLTDAEVDLHLEDHGSSEASLELADGARILVAGSPEFSRWIVWTLEGKDFVCLEPWTAPFDALNTGTALLEVPPGGTRSLWTTLSFVPA